MLPRMNAPALQWQNWRVVPNHQQGASASKTRRTDAIYSQSDVCRSIFFTLLSSLYSSSFYIPCLGAVLQLSNQPQGKYFYSYLWSHEKRLFDFEMMMMALTLFILYIDAPYMLLNILHSNASTSGGVATIRSSSSVALIIVVAAVVVVHGTAI